MATFTYTATSPDFKTGYTNNYWAYGKFAYQGNNATPGEYEYTNHCFGIMVFQGAGSKLKGRNIDSISFTFKFAQAGRYLGGAYKKLKIHESAYQDIDTSRSAVLYLNKNKILGSLDVIGYETTESFTLDANNNTALFNNLKNYFYNGNSAVIIYNDDDTSTDSYSRHFLQILEATITVNYDGGESVVYISNGTTFEAYQIYIDNGTSWDLYAPYIDNGSGWDSYG